MHFELGMRLALVAFDDHEIDRRQLVEQVGERRLGRAPQLMHQRPAIGGADQDFGGAGHAVAMQILAGLIHVEGMMRVLEGGDLQPALREPRNDFSRGEVVFPAPLQPAKPMMRMPASIAKTQAEVRRPVT